MLWPNTFVIQSHLKRFIVGNVSMSPKILMILSFTWRKITRTKRIGSFVAFKLKQETIWRTTYIGNSKGFFYDCERCEKIYEGLNALTTFVIQGHLKRFILRNVSMSPKILMSFIWQGITCKDKANCEFFVFQAETRYDMTNHIYTRSIKTWASCKF